MAVIVNVCGLFDPFCSLLEVIRMKNPSPKKGTMAPETELAMSEPPFVSVPVTCGTGVVYSSGRVREQHCPPVSPRTKSAMVKMKSTPVDGPSGGGAPGLGQVGQRPSGHTQPRPKK